MDDLFKRYGTLAADYAESLRGAAETPLASLPDYTVEEIRHIAENEYVEHLTDLICRRTLVALLGDARRDVLEELATIVARTLGWDAERTEAEVLRALEEVAT